MIHAYRKVINIRMLALEIYTELKEWAEASLAAIGDFIRNTFIFSIVVVEIFSETKLYARLRTFLIFSAAFVLFTWIAILIGAPPAQKIDFGLSLHQFCKKYGYILQNETVKTEDDYILTMHRIQCPTAKSNCKKQRPPVLIMHGLMGSSADFVIAKNQSIAFQLADRGYDVWLGNSRGNTYSRDHVMLDANEDRCYWKFSFHEHGVYDLPAMIDHIIAKTNFSKISYIGMSQGSTSYLVLTSTKPEYNKKILLSNLLAPVTTFYPTKSLLLKTWSAFNFIIERALHYIGPLELFGDNRIETTILRYLCLGPHKIANYVCIEQFLKYGVGLSDEKNYDLLPFHISVSPAGASVKQFQHMIQNRISGKFAQYDYHDKNIAIYSQETPPVYNVSKISSPVAVYFGKADIFVSVEGLYQQLKEFPNVALRYRVPSNVFNHMDFIYAKNLNSLVNNKLMEMIDLYNK